MFYNFKNRKLISLNNVRCVSVFFERPNRTEHWYIRVQYLDGKVIDLLADNYEDAQKQFQNIELNLNK